MFFHEIAQQVERYWQHPPPGASLCYEQARQRISFLSFEALSRTHPIPEAIRSENRVQNALRWYNQHLQDKPTLSQVAQAVHSSPSHLRRLFHESYQSSPKKLFDQLRYQKALQLLNETNSTMAAIADACSFQDQSAFSRAFKKQFKCSPIEMCSPRKD